MKKVFKKAIAVAVATGIIAGVAVTFDGDNLVKATHTGNAMAGTMCPKLTDLVSHDYTVTGIKYDEWGTWYESDGEAGHLIIEQSEVDGDLQPGDKVNVVFTEQQFRDMDGLTSVTVIQ